jgi:hypothetical protein
MKELIIVDKTDFLGGLNYLIDYLYNILMLVKISHGKSAPYFVSTRMHTRRD